MSVNNSTKIVFLIKYFSKKYIQLTFYKFIRKCSKHTCYKNLILVGIKVHENFLTYITKFKIIQINICLVSEVK